MIEAFRLKKSTIKVVHMNYLLYSQCFEAEQYFCVRNLLLTENLHPQWAVTRLLVNWVKRFSKKNHKSDPYDSRDILQVFRNHKLRNQTKFMFQENWFIQNCLWTESNELFVQWKDPIQKNDSMKRSDSNVFFFTIIHFGQLLEQS